MKREMFVFYVILIVIFVKVVLINVKFVWLVILRRMKYVLLIVVEVFILLVLYVWSVISCVVVVRGYVVIVYCVLSLDIRKI